VILLSDRLLSSESQCPYLPDRLWRFAFFFAIGVSAEELEALLASGWRKFGEYYFKPQCRNCSECIPLRIRLKDFHLSRSQRRVVKKCQEVEVKFNELELRDEIYEVYKDHSLKRFGKETDYDDFAFSFYNPSCPAMQSEYFIDGRLAAVGFLDVSSKALSSVYFCFHSDFEDYSLGTFSCIKEIEFAAKEGLQYYYLGYYIKDCQRMIYKDSFKENEKMEWETGQWLSSNPLQQIKASSEF